MSSKLLAVGHGAGAMPSMVGGWRSRPGSRITSWRQTSAATPYSSHDVSATTKRPVLATLAATSSQSGWLIELRSMTSADMPALSSTYWAPRSASSTMTEVATTVTSSPLRATYLVSFTRCSDGETVKSRL